MFSRDFNPVYALTWDLIFQVQYSFNRKRNMIELEVKQEPSTSRGRQRFVECHGVAITLSKKSESFIYDLFRFPELLSWSKCFSIDNLIIKSMYFSYVGPLIVVVQELDGSFTHTVQIDSNHSKHDLQCHSKVYNL